MPVRITPTTLLFASCFAAWILSASARSLLAADLSEHEVKAAIKRGSEYLTGEQQFEGSWSSQGIGATPGVTSLCVLALLNSGMPPDAAPVQKGLRYLRKQSADDLSGGKETYQVCLMIMALVAAKEKSDLPRIAELAHRLEQGQLTKGTIGGWTYSLSGRGFESGDQSNTQFAILGLREAVDSGYRASRTTWERAKEYWENCQSAEGGWGYSSRGGRPSAKGSMTVAGIASMAIIQQMLKTDEGVATDGTPPCCDEQPLNQSLQLGLNWLGRNFSIATNPGTNARLFYYIYGMERAGRLSGQRFFGRHDWYREGADYLLRQQQIDGSWIGKEFDESNASISTSFALLFLSKGLAPVLINKVKYGKRNPNNPEELFDSEWNRHPRDVRNLAELISSLPHWPKLLTTQELDLAKAVKSGGVNSLLQGSVLFLTGPNRLEFTADEIKLLREYLEEGGFIFACPTCQSDEFEPGFRALVARLMPQGEGELKLLPPEHPVYRSEHPLDPNGVKLHGVDFGCRTSIIYSPEDLGCLWDYWASFDPPGRNPQLIAKIHRATRIGVNVMAYATMRQPPDKTQIREVAEGSNQLDPIDRGLFQIAQVKHEGAWNTAPRALKNLLLSLNENVGMSASTKIRELTLDDKNVFRYPILYMHGRNRFAMSEDERQLMRKYLERGGVLFADACCGAKAFDQSFREFMIQLYPDQKLERISASHDIFSDRSGRDIKSLKRRTSETGENGPVGSYTIRSAEPFLEGIELDGRYAIIYSKYDISCALERQNTGHCEGYLSEDAVILGTNIVRYAMLQNLRLKK